jgi:hypothetical protein
MGRNQRRKMSLRTVSATPRSAPPHRDLRCCSEGSLPDLKQNNILQRRSLITAAEGAECFIMPLNEFG